MPSRQTVLSNNNNNYCTIALNRLIERLFDVVFLFLQSEPNPLFVDPNANYPNPRYQVREVTEQQQQQQQEEEEGVTGED